MNSHKYLLIAIYYRDGLEYYSLKGCCASSVRLNGELRLNGGLRPNGVVRLNSGLRLNGGWRLNGGICSHNLRICNTNFDHFFKFKNEIFPVFSSSHSFEK